jgi:hypothetical protein
MFHRLGKSGYQAAAFSIPHFTRGAERQATTFVDKLVGPRDTARGTTPTVRQIEFHDA